MKWAADPSCYKTAAILLAKFNIPSNSRFDFTLPACRNSARERDNTPAPSILGDRGVLLGTQYRSPSHGVTTASGGRSAAAADIASAGPTDTRVWKDPPVVRPHAAMGQRRDLGAPAPVLWSLWRVPPIWAYCVVSGPK